MTFPEASAVWRPRDKTEQIGTIAANSIRFVAPGSELHGQFGLFELSIAPRMPGAIPHYHPGFTESFYVMSGRLAVMTGTSWQVAGSGDFVYVPTSGVHAFRSGSDDELTRFLLLFVPGSPRETYFRGLAEFGERDVPPTPEEIDEFALSCGQVNLRDWVSEPFLGG